MKILKRNNVHQLGNPDGPVLLFAHGFGCNQKMWNRITPAFDASYRQILFDYVGSGQSDVSAFNIERYGNLNGYAQDVLDICDALDLTQNVTFVGHSVSASIGLLASIARPALFDKLVLIGPSACFLNDPPDYMGGFNHEDLEGLLSLMEQNYVGWANYLTPVVMGQDSQTALTGELSDSFCSTDPVVARVFAQATFFADNRKDLPKVTRPCLILQHRLDSLVPLAVGEYLHQHLAGSTLEVMDAKGHCAHMSHPDVVVAAMRRYLSNHPALQPAA
ncbi:MAG: alpha/beta hydrolase [Rhodoferax sp.]|nr:alpha/beta hydrolase [Betaproteobacteria bacterium]NCN96092.1 alpha/beta hydrolase [Rhodoferax sp.]OIP13063.1 MAG: sigma factor SigB regulation protein RsbQ [Comamonadaceae bacterium CG2_30_57_122]PIZ23253.1 MAG: sigma factor SigB regulation protein RsbQ [Comamonadaceae bacterium CG_4_10_14_0_8_um_filter_57_29]PJC15762.1 MAG: sigma factor SigB regulation protein RsbQ [Comamonadaceae bacterium CG_4_9_14_0_8_um_filter_57_21]